MSARKWTPEQRATQSIRIKESWTKPERRAGLVAEPKAPRMTPEERREKLGRNGNKGNPPKIDSEAAYKLHLEGKSVRAIRDLLNPAASHLCAYRAVLWAKKERERASTSA